MPLLNRPEIDSIPEMKAIFLLLFNYASQEIADLYGPFPYVDFKANKQSSPFTYNDLRTIYVNIKANVDTVLKCLHYFDQKPEWYKSVSYTHLDVYKRQEQSDRCRNTRVCREKCGKRQGDSSEKINFLRGILLNYTIELSRD